MKATITVSRRGMVTLPAKLRQLAKKLRLLGVRVSAQQRADMAEAEQEASLQEFPFFDRAG